MASVLRIILILMPFFVYFTWLRAVKRQQKLDSISREEDIKASEGRVMRAVGFALAAAVAIAIWVAMETERHPRDANYVPPHTENGKVVPGGFIDFPSKETDQAKP